MDNQYIELKRQIAEYRAVKTSKWQRAPGEIKDQIKKLYYSGNYSVGQIAREFGFSTSLISHWIKPPVKSKKQGDKFFNVTVKSAPESPVPHLAKKELRAVLPNGVVIFGLSFEQTLMLNDLRQQL